MIPFGRWHPDIASVPNSQSLTRAFGVVPTPGGFGPFRALVASSNALGSTCLGAATYYDNEGNVFAFAGDSGKLYQLDNTATWQDVSRVGAGYAVSAGARWRFANYGSLVVAVSGTEKPQKFLMGTSAQFQDLGGTPPQARYVAVVRDFLVLGAITVDDASQAQQRRVQWSGLANAEHWTPGTQSADFQDFQAGGPVRGLVGGEVGYVFQADTIQRMNYEADTTYVFSFDEIEGGRGLAAPDSLVKVGRSAYFLSSDGFYRLDLQGAATAPVGVGKWADAFRAEMRSGTETSVIGGLDPIHRRILWGYVSQANSSVVPDRVLVYDWALDEASTAPLVVTAFGQWLTQGVTLDSLPGALDNLPFSLDSQAYKGGAPILGVFSTDRKLSYQLGTSIAVTLTTADGQAQNRTYIRGIRPNVNTNEVRVAVSVRERQGDLVAFHPDEGMEDTGQVPAHASGWLARARVTIPAGAAWSEISGLTTDAEPMGIR